MALEEGLIVPVVHDTDKKSLKQIAQEARGLAEKARAGKLTLEEVSGGTFTVSNLGMFGVDGFTPILNAPQTGILGVGRIVEKPVIYRGEIAKRSTMVLSLTFDHRVIDGAPAGAFLQTVADLLAHGNRISLDAQIELGSERERHSLPQREMRCPDAVHHRRPSISRISTSD